MHTPAQLEPFFSRDRPGRGLSSLRRLRGGACGLCGSCALPRTRRSHLHQSRAWLSVDAEGRASWPGEEQAQARVWEGRRAVSPAALLLFDLLVGMDTPLCQARPDQPRECWPQGRASCRSCGTKQHREPTISGCGSEQSPRRRSKRSFVGSVDNDLGPHLLPEELHSLRMAWCVESRIPAKAESEWQPR